MRYLFCFTFLLAQSALANSKSELDTYIGSYYNGGSPQTGVCPSTADLEVTGNTVIFSITCQGETGAITAVFDCSTSPCPVIPQQSSPGVDPRNLLYLLDGGNVELSNPTRGPFVFTRMDSGDNTGGSSFPDPGLHEFQL